MQLTEDQKLFIVELLATFHRPSQVVALLREQYGIEATRQQVDAYNPATLAGRRLSAELRDHFAEIRKAFLADRESIAIAQVNYRQRIRDEMLSELMDLPANRRNPMLLMDLLEQAAKDEGGYWVKEKTTEGFDTLRSLRELLSVPLDAGETGPVEAAAREAMRRQQEAADLDEQARLETGEG